VSFSEKILIERIISIKKNYTYSEILVTFFLNVDIYIGFIYICGMFKKYPD